MLLTSYSACSLLVASCLALELVTRRCPPQATASPPSPANPAFRTFRRGYYLVYFPALLGDWLQGPYLYKLYQRYGFLEEQISILYVCGFASNVLFGSFAPFFVDSFGRKKSCVLATGVYSLGCCLKLSRDYWTLGVGRVLGGLATALLFSSFEAWYLHQHLERHDFPREWLLVTSGRVAFWNNVIAVGAGGVADFLAEGLGWGPVAPFVASVPFLVASGLLALWNWEENYGKHRTFSRTCGEGLKCLLGDQRVLLLGTIQALFESIISIFIFLWTPVLDPYGAPLGIVFSSFMASSALGSSLYRLALTSRYHLQPVHLLGLSVLFLFFPLFILTFSTTPGQENPTESFLAFLLLEFSCGLYFPAMGFLRRHVVPEKELLGVMNWFRVPLNLLACLGLLVLHGSDHRTGTRNILGACAGLALLALVAAGRLFARSRLEPELRLPEGTPWPEGTVTP